MPSYIPTLEGDTSPGTRTYLLQIGEYEMLNANTVKVYVRCDWTNSTGSGYLKISMPLKGKNVPSMWQMGSANVANVVVPAGTISLVSKVPNNEDVCYIATTRPNDYPLFISDQDSGIIEVDIIYEIEP